MPDSPTTEELIAGLTTRADNAGDPRLVIPDFKEAAFYRAALSRFRALEAENEKLRRQAESPAPKLNYTPTLDEAVRFIHSNPKTTADILSSAPREVTKPQSRKDTRWDRYGSDW